MGNQADCITTHSGIHMNPLDPKPEDFRIEDIAHALPLICRGNGHVKTFFSVGQHCINCAREADALSLPDRIICRMFRDLSRETFRNIGWRRTTCFQFCIQNSLDRI